MAAVLPLCPGYTPTNLLVRCAALLALTTTSEGMSVPGAYRNWAWKERCTRATFTATCWRSGSELYLQYQQQQAGSAPAWQQAALQE